MSKFKKALITVVAAAMVATNVVGLSGCGKKSAHTSDPVNVVAYDGSSVSITLYHTWGSGLQEKLNASIRRFNETFPNITVKSEYGGNWDAIEALISQEMITDKHPNLAFCYPDHVAQYNATNQVADLDGYIASNAEILNADGTPMTDKEGNMLTMGYTQAQLSDFVEGYYNEGKAYADGRMYTLPIAKSTELLYYNKTVFDANGWTPPTTWVEMKALCQTILAKSKEEGNSVVPLGYDSEANWFITMAEQYGEPYTDANAKNPFQFNTAKNREFVEELREWYQAGLVTTQELCGGYTSDLFTETAKTTLKAYMTIGSSGGATYQGSSMSPDGEFDFEVGIAPIPQVDPTNPKVIQQGPSMCIFKKSDMEVAASFLLTKHLTTDVQFQASVSMNNGYSPVMKSVRENATYKDWLDEANGLENVPALAVKMTLELADTPGMFFTSDVFEGSAPARQKVGLLLKECISESTGGKSAADFISSKFKTAITELKQASEF